MKKFTLPNQRIVYINGTTLQNSGLMICREFADPRSRRWCVMERDNRKDGNSCDAWTNIHDCSTKREAAVFCAELEKEYSDQRAEDEAVYFRNLGI